MRRRVMGNWLALALVLIVLAGCAPGGDSPARSSGVAPRVGAASPPSGGAGAAAETAPAPAPLHQFELPMASTNATMAPFWVAAEQGLFRRHGLDLTLVNLPPATATQALTAGSVPIAATGGSTTTAYVGGARELVYVAGVSNKAPYRMVSRPDITRLDDLRGRAIGLGTAGSSPAVALADILRRQAIEPERDVTFTYLRDPGATVAALLTGSVQAIVTGSPQAEYAMAEGNRLLLDMRELNLPILGINVSTTRPTIERDPDLLRRVLMAYIEGIQFAQDHPTPSRR